MWDKEDRQILMVNSTVGTTCGKENKDRVFHDTMTAQSKG